MIILPLRDNSRGCIKVGLFYIACLVIICIIISLRSYYKEPIVDDVKTTREFKYEYSNKRYLCPSGMTYYSVLKGDSIEKPNRQDTCIQCGKPFRNHHYQKTPEEEEWENAIRDAFLETPAE